MTLSPSPSFAPASCVTRQPVHLNPTDDVVLRVSGDDVTCCVYSFRLPRASRRSEVGLLNIQERVAPGLFLGYSWAWKINNTYFGPGKIPSNSLAIAYRKKGLCMENSWSAFELNMLPDFHTSYSAAMSVVPT